MSTAAADPHTATDSPTASSTPHPEPSINLLADTIFANGLGAHPNGLLPDCDDIDAVEHLVPLRQRMSDVMVTAHETVDEKMGSALADLNLAELEALRTQITLREKQVLTTSELTEVFAPLDPKDHGFAASTGPEHEAATAPDRTTEGHLSLVEYVQIREENADLAETVSTRATADLVQYLRRPEAEIVIPGRRRGETPLKAATSFVASVLRSTFAAVDKRVSAAAAMWPEMQYRPTKLSTPLLASQLEQGRIPFASASAAQQKLSDIRQAVRRAGGDEPTADDLIAQKEREFVHHAVRNNPHTFSRYAKSRSDAVTNALIGPQRSLTDEQLQHEKGLFYDGPIGDSLHRVTAIVDEGQLLHLNAIRELATRLDSAISTIQTRPDAEEDEAAQPRLSPEDENAADDVANNPRITPADVDFGIAQLFDGQTKADRWLNTLMDFLSAGLILRKTYTPSANDEEQQRCDDALDKAAEHSEVLADILGMGQDDDDDPPEAEPSTTDTPPDPLAPFIPPGYQLLRPNLEVIVEMSLQDFDDAGCCSEEGCPLDDPDNSDSDNASKVARTIEQLNLQKTGIAEPVGSPGNVTVDPSIARQQACANRIIPMVLGSASQPLDVGRAQRLFPRAIRRALHVRDRGCIVPGCTVPAAWCDGHHTRPWERGGPTSLANAALLCRNHHGATHKALLTIHLEADGLPSVSLPKSVDPTQTRYRNVYWQR